MFFVLSILALLTAIVFLFVYLDKKKLRIADINTPITFIVPCYNDGDSVQETIDSIYESCAVPFELIVVNDRSTDDSLLVLRKLKNKYNFRLLNNEENLGKSRTLNKVSKYAKNEIMIFVDADVTVNSEAINNVLLRLNCNDKVGAVSCPYKPKNKGFLPLMQAIEYNMTIYVKGSYNLFSAINLWGGFLAVKKKAFVDVDRFSINAITEDIDLAYKLNRKGWKVEQSFVKVLSYVPFTFRTWFKQKIRWSSGGIQANWRYPDIWMRNPIHMLFFLSYSYLTFSYLYSLLNNLFFVDNMFVFFAFLSRIMEFTFALKFTWNVYGNLIIENMFIKLLFTVFILPYSFSSISFSNDFLKILLIIPFSIGYMPVYMVITVFSFFIVIRRSMELSEDKRAW